jgi:hypothetical protein
LGLSLFPILSVVVVTGAAGVLLSQGPRLLAASWLGVCSGLGGLVFALDRSAWPAALALLALGAGPSRTLAPLAFGAIGGFIRGSFRKTAALVALWVVSLVLLRSSHAHAASHASARYWLVYASAALFGIGFLVVVLKRNLAHGWFGLGLLLLSPLPAVLSSVSTEALGEAGWLLAVTLAFVIAHSLLAAVFLGGARRLGDNLDVEGWEELQG